MDELETCMRCGFCRANCPVFDESRAEPSSARGKIALINALYTGEIGPTKGVYDRLFECILCGKCRSNCPAGVDTIGIFVKARSRLLQGHASKQKKAALRMLEKPKAMKIAGGVARLMSREKKARSAIKRAAKSPAPNKRIALFPGCVGNYLDKNLTEACTGVLEAAGYEVQVVDENCCGAPFYSSGAVDRAVSVARKNLKILIGLKVDAIVTPCPTCMMSFQQYPEILSETENQQALEIWKKVFEICDFMEPRMPKNRLGGLNKLVTYHESCHMNYGLGLSSAGRGVLKGLDGLELVEMEDPSACCGFGGLFSLDNPDLSRKISQRKIEDILSTAADEVVTPCPGCKLHLGRALQRRGSNLAIRHPLELLYDSLKKREVNNK